MPNSNEPKTGKLSKDTELFIRDMIAKAVNEPKYDSGEDAAGYANALLMAAKAYYHFYVAEQQTAMNLVSSMQSEVPSARDSQN